MRFLVDVHLPCRLVYWLCALWHEAVHTLDLPCGNRTLDVELCDISVRNQAIVVTKDADFVNTFTMQHVYYKLLLLSTRNIKMWISVGSLHRISLTLLQPLRPTILSRLPARCLSCRNISESK